VRAQYTAELEQLRLQVEVMAVRVDQNLERMRTVLDTGSEDVAGQAIEADDEIDAMNLSLTERCYDLLRREQPVAADLRLVMSVIRITGELERVGDLALRVVKLAPDHGLVSSCWRTWDIVIAMADEAIERYREAMRAWGTEDLGLATELSHRSKVMTALSERLGAELPALEGPDAAAIAVRTLVAGQALDRIADHAAVMGARMRYLITGDPNHLAAEVR